MNATAPDVDEDLPPSAGFVVFALEERGGSVARQELVDETWLNERTLDRAVDRLEALDVVRRDRDDGGDLRCVRITFVDENSRRPQ